MSLRGLKSKHASRVTLQTLRCILVTGALVWFALARSVSAQTANKSDSSKEAAGKPDLTKEPTLYVVGYAHLDTEWRWEYPQVINEYLRKTMDDNFALLGKTHPPALLLAGFGLLLVGFGFKVATFKTPVTYSLYETPQSLRMRQVEEWARHKNSAKEERR